MTVFRKVEDRNTVGELTWKFLREREIWATFPDSPNGTFETKNTDEIYPGWIVQIGEEICEVTHVIDRLDGGLKIVEIGIKACVDLPRVRVRWTAASGFLPLEDNTDTEEKKP